MNYFLGLSAQYSTADVFRHLFAYGTEYDLSELRAFLAAHYGATYDHVAIYSNGRTALNVAVKALAKRGGKVVITSMTCYAVVQAVKSAGCVPIFADIDPETLHFGKKELEKAIEGESNVQAVIVQNNLGIPADIEGIEEVAKAKKLAIIEDLAHCTGVKYADGREAGTVGRAVALSFGKGKSIDTVTGGAVIFTDPLDTPVAQPTDTPRLSDNFRARFYPFFGLVIRGFYNIHPKVGKYLTSALVRIGAIKRSADAKIDTKVRLTYWQCSLALTQLRSLPHSGRKPIRNFYLVKDRESVLRKFELDGYFFNDIWYDLPVAPERYYRKADFHPAECPVATEIAKQIVNLPTYYNQAEMKSALKIIQRYAANEIEFEELKDEDNLTEAEKKAKIKAEKKAKAKAKRDEKLNKSKKHSDNKKEQKAGEDNQAATKSQDDSEKTESQEKATKKVVEKVASIAKSKVKASSKKENKKEEEVLSALEEKSSLLAAAEESKKTEKTSDKSTSSSESKPKSEPKTKPEPKPEPEKKPKPEPEPEVEPEPAKTTVRNTPRKEPVMRVAPKKLTEREKLKLELEKGRKDGPSVL